MVIKNLTKSRRIDTSGELSQHSDCTFLNLECPLYWPMTSDHVCIRGILCIKSDVRLMLFSTHEDKAEKVPLCTDDSKELIFLMVQQLQRFSANDFPSSRTSPLCWLLFILLLIHPVVLTLTVWWFVLFCYFKDQSQFTVRILVKVKSRNLGTII